MKYLLLICVLAAAAASEKIHAAGKVESAVKTSVVQESAPTAEYAPAEDYGLRASNWKLTPDAEKLLAEWY